ncbi:MFS transporter [uncultured Muribaculum sp.]|uniref:MFS transporter n=1 Tax=uncultured Muribaculum sp. TaxID=1918613 RepID=UPI0025952823|nr:MFS transporter [uncultured Muribaculum sp.]
MTEKVKQLINDKAWARWTALILVASMMFFAYMFVDVMSPLQSLIETQRGWSPDAFGYYAGAEYILNVFGFLILAGIILDKMGVRFTGTLSASVMVVGACIKFYAVSSWFQGTGLEQWLNSWWVEMPGSAKLAAFGFMIFGCGCEMAGITVSKAIAKWFEGKEMALAMGLEMAIARLGVFAIFSISPRLADWMGKDDPTVVIPVGFCTCLLIVGLLCYIVFTFFDTKLDKQLGDARDAAAEPAEEEFKLSDVGKIFGSKLFWIVAMLCVLYYSAIFPFQRYAANMLQCTLHISATTAADIFRWFPMGAMVLTPLLGYYLDRKGKGASMLILGAILMIVCHLTFALLLPVFPSEALAFSAIVILGVSFSLVPAALWPSVPKIMEARFLGSAYSLIFWVQNIGLALFPILIGQVLTASNPGVTDPMDYNYTNPMLLFASLGVLALLFGIWLKIVDAKNHYGLELPNIVKNDEEKLMESEGENNANL